MRFSFKFRFRFRLIPFVATVLLVALGVSLAQWQTRRGDQKQAIENAIKQRGAEAPIRLRAANESADQLEYRRVTVRGDDPEGVPESTASEKAWRRSRGARIERHRREGYCPE